MNARQRREFASFQSAGGSVEVYTLRSRLAPIVLRLLAGRRSRQYASVVHLPPRRLP
jgi:hypothetical protein